MKMIHDPFQAIAVGGTGVIARGLLAVAAVLAGGTLSSYPEVDGKNAIWIMLFPALVFYLTKLAGVVAFLCLGITWFSACAFIRFNFGKWMLYTIFSSALYGLLVWDALDYQGWEKMWELHHWPLFFPLFVGVIISVPEIINCWLRQLARKAGASKDLLDEDKAAKP